MFAVVFPQKESKSMTYIQFLFIYVEHFQRGLGTEIYKSNSSFTFVWTSTHFLALTKKTTIINKTRKIWIFTNSFKIQLEMTSLFGKAGISLKNLD